MSVLSAGTLFLAWVLLSGIPPAAAGEEARERVEALRRILPGEELPLEALIADPGRTPASLVPAALAADDVDRLFRLFARGYSGYEFFGGAARFDAARKAIRAELAARPEWRTSDLAALLRKNLGFIRDCHTNIGGIAYGEHLHFWFDPKFSITKTREEYRFEAEGRTWVLNAIDRELLKPSLDADGKPVFRIGVVSAVRPAPTTLTATGDEAARAFEVEWRRSGFTSYSRDLFREDRVGGVPVLRIRTFSEHHEEDITRFLDAADRLRGAPCLVVDLRGNGGGSERYVSEFVRRLTGRRPGSVFITSELVSRTTLAGRANYMARLGRRYPDTDFYDREAAAFRARAGRLAEAEWTATRWPANPRIPNPTTVVIVTNGLVASAGEGFVLRMGQTENVVVVGENTRGALTFGNVSAHQLPGSGLLVRLPINFGLFPDLVFREETGLEPDFWVPAPDAVNCAVAALRRGTIATSQPAVGDGAGPDFVREDTEHRRREVDGDRRIAAAIGALAGLAFGAILRRRPARLILVGLVYVGIGVVWIVVAPDRKPTADLVGYAGVAFGAAGAAVGIGRILFRRRRSTMPKA